MKQKKLRKLKILRKKRKRKNTYKKKAKKNIEVILTILCLSFAVSVFIHTMQEFPLSTKIERENLTQENKNKEEYQVLPAEKGPCGRPEIIQDFIVKNPYSRSGIALKKVKGIVVHYVANAGSTAEENRNYFENLKDTHLTKASSHFIIGLDGEIIQCIPLEEISYASNDRNSDTISIECCHEKKNGKFTKKTYQSLVKLTAWLCATYGITENDVIRHYDVTGKMCPKYFVKHEDAWKDFLSDIRKKLEKIE